MHPVTICEQATGLLLGQQVALGAVASGYDLTLMFLLVSRPDRRLLSAHSPLSPAQLLIRLPPSQLRGRAFGRARAD